MSESFHDLPPLKSGEVPFFLRKNNNDLHEKLWDNSPRTMYEITQEGWRFHAQAARVSLRMFTREFWPVIEPNKLNKSTYKQNWHIDAICEHLQAVRDGKIRNLLINVPPRHCKSIIISVMFPVWCWIDDPAARFLYSSYSQALSTRDALKSRRILQSNLYRQFKLHWYRNTPETKWELSSDQNVKQRYDNTKTGYRIATSVGGITTGDGGDFILCDDPHNVLDAESDVIRENTILWWDEAMSSRLNDPETGAKIIIMQRTHEHDLAGHVLEKGGYTHLMLPMEYEPDRAKMTSIGFIDPRREEGELLHPSRVGVEAAADLKRDLGTYASAGQLQQRPSAREGNLIKVDNLNFVESIDQGNVKKRWRSWDKAGTDGGGAFTVGTLVGRYKKPRPHSPNCGHLNCRGSLYFVEDVVRGQWSAGRREKIIKDTSKRDGKAIWIVVEQEPGSGGLESAENTVLNMPDRHVEIDTVHGQGPKEIRADPFAVAVENGEYDVIIKEWNEVWKSELAHFPHSRYKDQTDSVAQGHNKVKRKVGLHFG